MGTNRFTIVLSKKVIKIPKHIQGIEANEQEYKNFLAHPLLVANTKKVGMILIQEKLFDLEIFPKNTKVFPDYVEDLLKIKLHNRLQVGKDSKGKYKIFDYEDVKFYKGGN